MKNLLRKWEKSEIAWLVVSLFVVMASSIYDKASLLEVSTSIIGVVYVILIAKGYNISNLVGIIYVSIYGLVAWNTKFYGDMLMNIILIPLYVVSFIQWKKHTKDGLVEARNLTIPQTLFTGFTMIIFIFLLNTILVAMGGHYTLADSSNSILTITALILTIGRFSQQWICWLTNNVISTTMWIMAVQSNSINASFSIAVLKIIILANSIWGLYHWTKMGKDKGEK
jgi:nicotinamide mononucleotide transporter PnuC